MKDDDFFIIFPELLILAAQNAIDLSLPIFKKNI